MKEEDPVPWLRRFLTRWLFRVASPCYAVFDLSRSRSLRYKEQSLILEPSLSLTS